MNGYRCPRCKNTEIIDYGNRFDCPLCELEFEEKDTDEFKNEGVSLQLKKSYDYKRTKE